MRPNILGNLAVAALILSAGSAARAECLKGDCRNGVGVYTFSEEALYSGRFQGGNPIGGGVFLLRDGRAVRVLHLDADGFLHKTEQIHMMTPTALPELVDKLSPDAHKEDEPDRMYANLLSGPDAPYIKAVHMKDGAVIRGESAWVSGGKIYIQKYGGTVSFPLEQVDLRKTFQAADRN
jgi:hypothetical protein